MHYMAKHSYDILNGLREIELQNAKSGKLNQFH